MTKVYKRDPTYTIGWTDPRTVFDGMYKNPPHTRERIILYENNERAVYKNDYIHGVPNGIREQTETLR